ncbi:MAG: hypothetical protein ABJN26_04660 [Stappiaceae bacterium]
MDGEHEQTGLRAKKRQWIRVGVLVLIYGGLLAGGHFGSQWLIGTSLGTHARSMVVAATVLYAVLLAIPFVPGIEISLALLAAFGQQFAILIYFATVIALCVSYLVGRLVPLRSTATLFEFLGLDQAKELVYRLEPLSAGQRLDLLMERAPKRIVPFLLNHNYVALVIALNMPGNAIIGGGGGIALLAGISGLFTFPKFVIAVCLAVLPVPMAVILMAP